eukprot:4076881-Lingulodinium_polyedra.AAC.1
MDCPCMDCTLAVHGHPMDNPTMDCPRTVHGLSMDCPGTVQRLPADCPWAVHGPVSYTHLTLPTICSV